MIALDDTVIWAHSQLQLKGEHLNLIIFYFKSKKHIIPIALYICRIGI